MNKIIVKCYLLLGCTLLSCDSNVKINEGEAQPIMIDLSLTSTHDEFISIRDLLTEVSYIPLRSSDLFFLTKAKKILEIEDKLLVLDGNKEELVAYDFSGNFIGRVGKKGEGPEEYRSVTDFVVDVNNRSIIIFSRADQSIIEFNNDLSFKRKIRLNIWAFQVSLLESGNLACYTYFSDSGSGDNISIFSLAGDFLEGRMPYPKNDLYIPMDYTGFIDGNFYTYPLSSKLFLLQEGQPMDNVFAEFVFPDQWAEASKFDHSKFLNSPRAENHFLGKFVVGKQTEEILFYYSFKESDYRAYALGARLLSGQVFGHFNTKHGFKSNSDLFGKIFFRGPYGLATYSKNTGYYYTSTDIESMNDLFYADRINALSELKQIDSILYSILDQERDHEAAIILKFKLREKYE